MRVALPFFTGVVDTDGLGGGEFCWRDDFEMEFDLGFLVADRQGHGALYELVHEMGGQRPHNYRKIILPTIVL
jgi:hypothetical protein